MEAIGNFRELGGLAIAGGTVRGGVLFRSGHLGDATPEDQERLRDLGIRTVVDLRNRSDIDDEGEDRLPDSITHHHVPILDEAGRGKEIRALIMRGDLDEIRAFMGGGRGHQMATVGSAAFVQIPERLRSFGPAMAIVADPDNWPVLWHCSAGKDRAGWIGTSLLLAAGAPRDVIVDHYVESNQRAAGLVGLFPDGEMSDLLRPFLAVHADFVVAQLDVVDDEWGGVAPLYRDGYGLSDDVVLRLTSEILSRGSMQ